MMRRIVARTSARRPCSVLAKGRQLLGRRAAWYWLGAQPFRSPKTRIAHRLLILPDTGARSIVGKEVRHYLRRTRTFTFLLLAYLLPPGPLLVAQSGRGTITGIVTDSSGAVVAGAEILIVETSTGVETKAVTTDTGVYGASSLPPGKYKVSVALRGFKTAVRDNIDLLLTQTLTLDLELQPGEITQQVTVSAEPPLLESSTQEIGTNINEKELHTWPILVGDGTRQPT